MGTLDEIAARARASFGYRLFTAMRYLAESDEVERIFTTDAAAYPLAGRKLKRDTAWSRQVLGAGEPYFANDAAGIRAAFDDAEKILGARPRGGDQRAGEARREASSVRSISCARPAATRSPTSRRRSRSHRSQRAALAS